MHKHLKQIITGLNDSYKELIWLRWLSGKESTNAGDRRVEFNPWDMKIPWRKKWQPTPVFLPGKFHGQRRLASCSPWNRKESDTTDRLSTHKELIKG